MPSSPASASNRNALWGCISDTSSKACLHTLVRSPAAGVTSDSTARVKAGDLVNFVAQQIGGKGGGKPDLAMAGGNEPAKLPQALASVPGWVAERL